MRHENNKLAVCTALLSIETLRKSALELNDCFGLSYTHYTVMNMRDVTTDHSDAYMFAVFLLHFFGHNVSLTSVYSPRVHRPAVVSKSAANSIKNVGKISISCGNNNVHNNNLIVSCVCKLEHKDFSSLLMYNRSEIFEPLPL